MPILQTKLPLKKLALNLISAAVLLLLTGLVYATGYYCGQNAPNSPIPPTSITQESK